MLNILRYKSFIPVLALILLLLPGCSSSFYIDPANKDYELNRKRLNYLGESYSSVISTEKSVIEADEIKVSGDSLIYIDNETEQAMWIPVSQVQRVEIRDNVNRVFNTVWFPIITVAGTGVISAISGNIAPVLVGAMFSPASAAYAFFFTGYKQFIFVHSPETEKTNITCPCQKKKY